MWHNQRPAPSTPPTTGWRWGCRKYDDLRVSHNNEENFLQGQSYELAKQLQDLVPSPGPNRPDRDRQRQRQPSNNKQQPQPQQQQPPEQAPVVEDDSSDEDEVILRDGTIPANDRYGPLYIPGSSSQFSWLTITSVICTRNPKPLRDLNRMSGSGLSAPAKGPSRPLPPTPDDDDTMRGASGQNSSPAAPHPHRQVMPDLLPQHSTGNSGPSTPVTRPTYDSPGQQGSPLTSAVGMQEKQRSFLSFGFGAADSSPSGNRRRWSTAQRRVVPPNRPVY